ncbi:MAG TPA: ATP-binding cassette domain-containing protein [Leadbetterella sp.]|nr:ATP-binding cassette domain-containing protein [Leadbetterella sp.]
MLEVSEFQKKYNNYIVLDIPLLDIEPGIHWFVGKNGSGKSTFFKSLAGIVPFQGQMRFMSLQPHQKACKFLINYSEAEPKYPDFVTAQEVLSFIAYAKKAPKGQLEKLVEHFGVIEYWKNNIGTYSSGMLKKVSLVTGFLGNPELIILDEPFILVDAASIEKLYELIVETQTQKGTSFFLSSHQDLLPEKLRVNGLYLVDNKTIAKK